VDSSNITHLALRAACSPPLQVSLEAVLSKYSVTPQKGLSFEPAIYNTTGGPRTFTLTNTGAFAFDFRLFDSSNPAAEPAPAPPPNAKDAKAKDKGKGKVAAEAVTGVTVGPFVASPADGQLEPGASATVEVLFNATGQQAFCESLGIDVVNRSATDHPDGIPFELVAESCVPGIECSKVEGIFEEHTIKKALDPFQPGRNEYGVQDKVRVHAFLMEQLQCAHVQPAHTSQPVPAHPPPKNKKQNYDM
jgi:hydrocephalus-inducing protein